MRAIVALLTLLSWCLPAFGQGVTPTTCTGGQVVTAITGTPSTVTCATPTVSSSGLIGTTTNDNAAAGIVGEFLSASVAKASALSLTSVTAKTITSINLPGGDWEVSGVCGFNPASTTTQTQFQCGLSTTTNSMPTSGLLSNTIMNWGSFSTAAVETTLMVGPLRASLASTTTYYLVIQASFATSTASGYGTIQARRQR